MIFQSNIKRLWLIESITFNFGPVLNSLRVCFRYVHFLSIIWDLIDLFTQEPSGSLEISCLKIMFQTTFFFSFQAGSVSSLNWFSYSTKRSLKLWSVIWSLGKRMKQWNSFYIMSCTRTCLPPPPLPPHTQINFTSFLLPIQLHGRLYCPLGAA